MFRELRWMGLFVWLLFFIVYSSFSFAKTVKLNCGDSAPELSIEKRTKDKTERDSVLYYFFKQLSENNSSNALCVLDHYPDFVFEQNFESDFPEEEKGNNIFHYASMNFNSDLLMVAVVLSEELDCSDEGVSVENCPEDQVITLPLRNMNTQNGQGYTPLIQSIKSRRKAQEISTFYSWIESLMLFGADVHWSDNEGNSPLYHLISDLGDLSAYDEARLLDLLIDAGANIEGENYKKEPVILPAFQQKRQLTLTYYLLKNGNFSSIGAKGNNFLHYFIKYDWSIEEINALIESVEEKGSTQLRDLMKEAFAKPNYLGQTPIYYAVLNKKGPDAVVLFRRFKLTPMEPFSEEGLNAFGLAIREESKKFFVFMVIYSKFKADALSRVNGEGETAIEYALRIGKASMADSLIKNAHSKVLDSNYSNRKLMRDTVCNAIRFYKNSYDSAITKEWDKLCQQLTLIDLN